MHFARQMFSVFFSTAVYIFFSVLVSHGVLILIAYHYIKISRSLTTTKVSLIPDETNNTLPKFWNVIHYSSFL